MEQKENHIMSDKELQQILIQEITEAHKEQQRLMTAKPQVALPWQDQPVKPQPVDLIKEYAQTWTALAWYDQQEDNRSN